MLETKGKNFYLNGEKLRILSGAIHYFRSPQERWADYIHKAKLMGLNTIETYVAWNVHEAEEGQYDFSGMYDLCRFLDEVKKAGMYAIVRPGPFICAEWEFGGLPYWLLNKKGIRLRCMNEPYIEAVSKWFDKLIPMLVPYQLSNGGNLIAVQIENEYGSYGNDKDYLNWLKEKMISCGLDKTFFFTSDGYTDSNLQGGTLPEVLSTVNFGRNADKAEAQLRKYQPDGPFMCGEFWIGWFEYWGGPQNGNARSFEQRAKEVEEILDLDGSVNLYMFHGGTNFGFTAGANLLEESTGFMPDVTSYDYCAPLSECGDITEKYLVLRESLKKYTDVPDEELPPPSRKKAYTGAIYTGSASLFRSLDKISKKISSQIPYPMEDFGQRSGYILYRTYISGPLTEASLILREVHDRAQVFGNGMFLGNVERNTNEKITLTVPPEGIQLDILVENQARVNYGPNIFEKKGITEGIMIDNQFQFGYDVYPLPMEQLESLKFTETEPCNEPVFCRFKLHIEECCDTYLDMKEWKKGFVVVNGMNIGRYWSIGPQQKLFIPKEFLRIGENEIIVFEQEQGRKQDVFDRAG